MASFKSHPVFYTSMLLAGALTAGQAWLIFSQSGQIAKERAVIDQKKQALQAFAFQSPFPSRDNLATVEAARAQVEKVREEIRGELRSNSDVAQKIASAVVPATPTDAYFDLSYYVERVRAAAESASIRIAEDTRFGFSDYAKTGPETELIPAVFIQRQYAEYLLTALLAAQPAEFLGLQRERPLTAEEKRLQEEAIAAGQTPTSSDSGSSGDFFTIDPRTSARVPGFVETQPFRVTFTGYTSALRNFLNELASFKLPVVVRSVEVEALNGDTSGQAQAPRPVAVPTYGDPNNLGAPVIEEQPLVVPTESRFTVTVEIVSLVDNTQAPAATP
jgi:hypothetical protein